MHFCQMKKSCATIIFLSHFATMAIDSANPGLTSLFSKDHYVCFEQTSLSLQRVVLANVGKNARGKNVIGKNVGGKIARGKNVKVVKLL